MKRTIKNVVSLAAVLLSGALLTSCGDERVELVKNYHKTINADSSLKINLPQDVVVNGENVPITPSDSITIFTDEVFELESVREKALTNVNKYKTDLKTESYKGLRDLYKEFISEGEVRIAGYDNSIKELNDKISSYQSMDGSIPLAYTFDATIVTKIPLNDMSIEVLNTYVLSADKTTILSASSKSNPLSDMMKSK